MAFTENPMSSIQDFLTGGNSKKAAAAGRQAAEVFQDLEIPQIDPLELELLVSQGKITPEMASTILQGQSATAGITTDPKLKQAQMDALASLQDISSNGGMTLADKANLSRIATDEATKSRGAREAILSNAAERGMGSSGLSVLSQMKNQQSTADRQAQRDLDVAGMAQARALEALEKGGILSGNMENAEFGRGLAKAEAQDAISRFNTTNLNANNASNVAARNAAQEANLANKQRIADANVATKNTQQASNQSIAQQDYENLLKKKTGQQAGYNSVANAYSSQGDAMQKLIGTGLQAGAVFAASDEDLKEDIEDFDADAFLESIVPTKWKYKDAGKYGDGKNVGVMAQDLEREVPQMVEEDQEGNKMVDYSPSKAGGPIFASLADLHRRLKDIEGR